MSKTCSVACERGQRNAQDHAHCDKEDRADRPGDGANAMTARSGPFD